MSTPYAPPSKLQGLHELLPEIVRALEAEAVDPQVQAFYSQFLPSEDELNFYVLKKVKLPPPLVALTILSMALPVRLGKNIMELNQQIIESELGLVAYVHVQPTRGFVVCAGEEVAALQNYDPAPHFRIHAIRQRLREMMEEEMSIRNLPAPLPPSTDACATDWQVVVYKLHIQKQRERALRFVLAATLEHHFPGLPLRIDLSTRKLNFAEEGDDNQRVHKNLH